MSKKLPLSIFIAICAFLEGYSTMYSVQKPAQKRNINEPENIQLVDTVRQPRKFAAYCGCIGGIGLAGLLKAFGTKNNTSVSLGLIGGGTAGFLGYCYCKKKIDEIVFDGWSSIKTKVDRHEKVINALQMSANPKFEIRYDRSYLNDRISYYTLEGGNVLSEFNYSKEEDKQVIVLIQVRALLENSWYLKVIGCQNAKFIKFCINGTDRIEKMHDDLKQVLDASQKHLVWLNPETGKPTTSKPKFINQDEIQWQSN